MKTLTVEQLAGKLNPRAVGYSAKMTAIVGAILGFDYGVRNICCTQLVSISITSDGFVLGGTLPVSSGVFLGSYDDLRRNVGQLLQDAKLSVSERKKFFDIYNSRVTDYRAVR